MARRWLVNTTTNRLTGVTDDDSSDVIPSGRTAVYELIIRASGASRADIKPGGLWIVTNGVGAYTPPAAPTTGQTRGRRRTRLARNIIKNWLPASSGALAITYPDVSSRLRVQIDAMTRVLLDNGAVDDHYDAVLAETEVNGLDFVLYAGPQWDNTTDGYYREPVGGNYPGGSWTFHTINQNLAGSPSEGNTGGVNHTAIGRSVAPTINWMREIWKLANP